MKSKLTLKETIVVASTLFGMFFGAGNLIFPVHLGQMAGSNSWPAIIGFCITAVSIPILAVAAIGNTHSADLFELSSKVTGWYGLIFTTLLYLTIGPFFAIPRCVTDAQVSQKAYYPQHMQSQGVRNNLISTSGKILKSLNQL